MSQQEATLQESCWDSPPWPPASHWCYNRSSLVKIPQKYHGAESASPAQRQHSRQPLSTHRRRRSSSWWASRQWWAWSRASCSGLHLPGGRSRAWGAGEAEGAGCQLGAGGGQVPAGGRCAGRSSFCRTRASRCAPQSRCTQTFSGSRGSLGWSGAS